MPIFKSRKFWIAVFDILVSSLTYFLPRYLNPTVGEHVLWLIGAWQPVFLMIIVGITDEDVALKKSGIVYDPISKSYIAKPEPVQDHRVNA